MKKITACILFLAIFVLPPVTARAQETTLSTKIPSSHTLNIELVGNGRILVDETIYTQTESLEIKRGTSPKITFLSTDGAIVKAVFLDGEEITEDVLSGTWSMPPLCFNAELKVVFEFVPNTPQTGDPVPLMELHVAAFISLIVAFSCFLIQTKRRTQL